MLTISIGGFVLALWFAGAVLWRTTHDVRRTVAAVTAIAGSDLAPRPLPEGRDEMGDIGRALVVARTRLKDQDDALATAEMAREQQLRAGFLHQRQAETQFRRRTQEIIDESTSVIAEELRQVTEKVGEVQGSSDVIDERITVADTATTAIVGQAHEAEQVITSLELSLRRVATGAALVTDIARISTAGRVVLHCPGRPSVPAAIVNVSAGGMRAALAGGAHLPEGLSLDVEMTGDGEELTVQARVANSAEGRDGQEIGLQFLITDEPLAERLAAFADRLIGEAGDR